MGRSYWFECSKCGYRAKVSGRTDRGVSLVVQTIVCQDCKELYDAVTRMRVSEEVGNYKGFNPLEPGGSVTGAKRPPTFLAALNRLNVIGGRKFKWLQFAAQCPVASFHRVKPWKEPDRCPRCGIYLEKNALPYRIWD